MTRLIVLETALDGIAGHFYQHAIGTALAARALGLETAVYANAHFRATQAEGVRIVPWFERPMDPGLPPTEAAAQFADALERLTAAERLTRDDILCLDTTSGRHLEGVLRWHRMPGAAVRPFLLVLLMFGPDSEPMGNAGGRPVAETLADLHAAGWSAAGACFAPEPVLPGAYAALSPLPVHPVPLAVRTDLVTDARPVPAPLPLTVTCLGDARPEKGFLLLPGLARLLHPTHGATGRLHFVIQSAGPYAALPDMRDAVRQLREWPPGYVTLVDSAPGTERYYRLLAETDIVLCPYVGDYRMKVSGVLTEALAAGKPAVVPAGSTLSALLPPDCGATFRAQDRIADALLRVVEHYEAFRAAARAGAGEQRRLHGHRHALKHMLDRARSVRAPTHPLGDA